MMRHAIADRIIKQNPFSGIKIDLSSDGSKNRVIDAASAIAILDACPDQEWRTLYALARYGGLRCPSEVLLLRWSDINWDEGRFTVTSPKTKRFGKGSRVVPLWQELLDELNSLFAIVEPGLSCPADSYVITRYRDTETNLRTTFKKIVERAGVPVFPKPFMALRASRRTELERTGVFANHVLNKWFGHSGAIAEAHYLHTVEDDFDRAIALPSLGVGQSVGQSTGGHRNQQPSTHKKSPVKPGS